MASLLIAEDDHILVNGIQTVLQNEGFKEVTSVDNGELALQCVLMNSYDLVILDIMLPKMDGLTVLKRIREQKPSLAIILLTAKDSQEDIQTGLTLGADAYLPKPFNIKTLLCYLNRLLQRSQILPQSVQQVGNLRLDRAGQRAWVGNKPLHLSTRELRVLDLHMSNIGRVVTKDRIRETLCNNGRPRSVKKQLGPNAVEVYMHRLRKKLAGHGICIGTIRGIGYHLEPHPIMQDVKE